MKVEDLHPWKLGIPEALRLQQSLSHLVCYKDEISEVRWVGGVDISAPNSQGYARGAVVILDYPSLHTVEVKIVEEKVEFPYVPGLLSFREAPLIISAFRMVEKVPQLLIVDGQGIAHPRRFGLASHLGVILDLPTIGCAKSLLCGKVAEAGGEPGSFSLIWEGEEVLGAALRTKPNVRPVYISIGHRTDLEGALKWILHLCQGYRLPEPTRRAHNACSANTKC